MNIPIPGVSKDPAAQKAWAEMGTNPGLYALMNRFEVAQVIACKEAEIAMVADLQRMSPGWRTLAPPFLLWKLYDNSARQKAAERAAAEARGTTSGNRRERRTRRYGGARRRR